MTWLTPSMSMPRAAMSVATSTRDLAGLEAGQRALALALGLVAVDRRGLDARRSRPLHDLVGAMLGAGEDEGARHRRGSRRSSASSVCFSACST